MPCFVWVLDSNGRAIVYRDFADGMLSQCYNELFFGLSYEYFALWLRVLNPRIVYFPKLQFLDIFQEFALLLTCYQLYHVLVHLSTFW